MIHLIFGGKVEDREFLTWTKQNHTVKYIKIFNGMKQGSLGEYARYCIESCKKLVKKNDFGDIVEVSMQNDTMMVHFSDDEVVDDIEKVVDRARGFYALARDLGLNCKLLEYKSHPRVVGIASFID